MTPLALALGVPGVAPRGMGYPVHRGCGGALVPTEAAPPAWWTAALPLVCALCHAGVDAPPDQVLRARDAALVERGVSVWPRCCSCDGPARPKGEPALRCEFLAQTRNETNSREHFRVKAKRVQEIREATRDEVAAACAAGGRVPLLGPWYVRLTRISPSRLDTDSAPPTLKAVRDYLAQDAIRIDDKSPLIEWAYDQVHGKALAVRVEIWGSGGCP